MLAVSGRTLGNIRTPNLIWSVDDQPSQQVGIYLVIGIALAQIPFGIKRLKAHQIHQTRYPLAVHNMPRPFELFRHFAASIKWRFRVLFINQPHKSKIRFTFLGRLVVEGRPAYSEQLTLPSYADPTVPRLDQPRPFLTGQLQLFF